MHSDGSACTGSSHRRAQTEIENRKLTKPENLNIKYHIFNKHPNNCSYSIATISFFIRKIFRF